MSQEKSMISLSKGCFVYVNNGKPTTGNDEHIISNESWERRKQLYQSTWAKIEPEIQAIQERANQNIIDAVITFVTTEASISQMFEIPTCAVILGVNSPDHSSFFNMLSEKLKIMTEYIVILNSKDCSNISNMVQKAVKMIIDGDKDDNEESVNLTKRNCTFTYLLKFYEDKHSSQCTPSPKKKKKTTKTLEKPPIVIILEDLEAFSAIVLQDFILICNSYLGKLPLVLIFGVATAMTTVHNLLTQKASSCLGVKSFYSFSPLDYLSQILQIIMDPSLPFKLGGKVFRFLVDIVLFHDFSVANLKHLLKFCLFQHYYENRSSLLCCESELLSSTIKTMVKSDLREIIRLPSFKRYLDGLKIEERNALLEKQQECQKVITQFLNELHKYTQESNILIYCLYTLSKDLPNKPFGKQITELYQLVLQKNIGTSKEFETVFKLLSMLSKEELKERLASFLSTLENQSNESDMKAFIEYRENILGFLNRLENISLKAPDEAQNTKLSTLDWGKMTSRSQFKEKLEKLATQKKSNPYEMCQQDIVEYLKSIFKSLRSPAELPLNEVLYFNDVVAIKKHMMASPRTTVHNALINPHLYLQCSCCKLHNLDEISSSLPDLSIAYKLHLEHGKMINLYDWFQAFCAVLEVSQPKKKRQNTNKKKEDHSILIARFMKCVAELQFLGYIKPTQRKISHVQRLTWGY